MNNNTEATQTNTGSLTKLFDALAGRNVIILAVVTVLVSVLIYYAASTYILAGYEADRNSLRNEVSGIIAKNRSAEAIMSNEKQYNRDYAQAYRISEDARQMLPVQETTSAVMEGVKILANNTGLKVTRFSSQQAPVASTFASSVAAAPPPPANGQPPAPAGAPPDPNAPAPPAAPSNKLFEVNATLQVRGTHESVMKFFVALAAHERIIQIKTFSINSTTREEIVDIQLSTFFAPPPDNLPPIPDEIKQLAASL